MPAQSHHKDTRANRENTHSHPEDKQALAHRPRVLVIDEDADLRVLLDLTLQDAGFEVFARADGDGALASMLTIRPDVVILDSVLPSYSGLELCTAIRSRRELDGTSIVMVSARSHDHDVELGYIAGADRYLVKPIVPGLLVQHVQELIDD